MTIDVSAVTFCPRRPYARHAYNDSPCSL